MSDIVIKAENLGKKYVIGHQAENGRYVSFREVLIHNTRTIWNKTKDLAKGKPIIQGDTLEEVWALKDVSFEIKRGEALGIIGRNGAGKSTLLKILSRITEPSTGRVTIKGRVASLLEVGTGFHPELTGRENIYLNGTILGMTRAEIKRKFDEIVAFAEVEKYLDTPVKRYSSGMYVRLAFAVAAHLEPEILVVDEVLAVGDAQFQKKCLGKMGEVAKEGRTVLFVSHNMTAVQQLCQQGIVLVEGKVILNGHIEEAVRSYMQNIQTVICQSDMSKRKDRKGSQWLKFIKIALYDSEGNQIQRIVSGQDVRIRFYYISDQEKMNSSVLIAFNVKTIQGHVLANLNSVDVGKSILHIYSQGYFECYWPKFPLRSGGYYCTLFCSVNGEIVDWLQNAFILDVEDGDYYKTGKLIERNQGDVLFDHMWASGNEILFSKNGQCERNKI
jgi:lipopolysaccharide transport system ATP-binding protein